jgi:DNA-binding NarL/FixJ family response regulator
MSEPIRVLIVDDSPQVREGLRNLLPLAAEAASLRLEIVGEAGNGREAIAETVGRNPDVVLMDLEMPVMDGCAATRVIKESHSSIRVVAMTVHGDPIARQRARQAGVDEYVVKGAPMPELIRAIRGSLA